MLLRWAARLFRMSATKTGLAGEYITAAAILRMDGWQVSMAQQDGIDLVAWKDNDFIRVQVKSSSLHSQSDRNKPAYQFQNASGSRKKSLPDADIMDVVAHCAIDQRRVHFQAACCVNKFSQRRQQAFFEKPDIEADSWDKAVSIVMETRR